MPCNENPEALKFNLYSVFYRDSRRHVLQKKHFSECVWLHNKVFS
uniref:Uncharacterized protein n=1 Tax=Anguilla anguilla TaxID=7936 RepID=A0A0E9TJA6_ANGAN